MFVLLIEDLFNWEKNILHPACNGSVIIESWNWKIICSQNLNKQPFCMSFRLIFKKTMHNVLTLHFQKPSIIFRKILSWKSSRVFYWATLIKNFNCVTISNWAIEYHDRNDSMITDKLHFTVFSTSSLNWEMHKMLCFYYRCKSFQIDFFAPWRLDVRCILLTHHFCRVDCKAVRCHFS